MIFRKKQKHLSKEEIIGIKMKKELKLENLKKLVKELVNIKGGKNV